MSDYTSVEGAIPFEPLRVDHTNVNEQVRRWMGEGKTKSMPKGYTEYQLIPFRG